MCRHNFRIAASIIICFLVQTQGADNYTDENRPYEFGFEVQVEGTKQQHRHEEKDKDGIIKGEFGFITADDVYHVTVYATDKDGHFKILSMKNIHLKSTTASAIGISSSTRQGPALGLSESTKSPVTQVTSARAAIPGIQLAPEKAQPFQTQAVSTITNNYTPQKTVALEPQTSFTPVPEPSPVRACSACSLPTSPKPPRPVPQVSDINSGSQPIRSNGAPNNPQLSPTIIINTHSQQQQQSKAPQYPRFSNEQLNSQTPAQLAFPLHESPNTQQALQPSLISNPQQGVSVADSEQNYHNELSQSSYPQQVPSIPTKASMFSQQPSQSSYTGQGPLVQPSPQQTSQSTYPIQGESALGISQPNFPHISQSLYPGGLSSLASKQPPTQQPSQAIYPAGSDSGGGQTPTQSAYPLQESSNTQQALQPSLISNPQQGVSVANSEQNYPNKLSQSSYPQQNPFIPYKASLFSQQPSQLSYPGQGPLVQPNPQQTSQLTYPVQGESALGISQPNFPHTSQSSYHGGLSSLASKEPLAQQPSQAIFPAGSDSGGRATLEQSNKSTYPVYESPIAGNGQPYSKQQGVVGGERTPKQYNEPQESVDLGQQGQAKPKLVSVDIQIVDKNTDIHALQPGEKEGLPGGLSAHDMSRLLYIFNYTVGFHGHFEEGFENGVKKGYYYVTGRNGVRTRIDYVADGTGFHPKVSQEVLDLLSDDVPKPETEKDAKYGLKSYEFKWLYYPVGS